MNRRRYSAYGFSIESELELEFADEAISGASVDLEIVRGTVSAVKCTTRTDEEIVIHGVGRFHVSGGRRIVADITPGMSPKSVSMILGGRVMAALLTQRGWLVLHAGAVDIEGRAALFAGRSGDGKSSTVAALAARGHRAITDDVAPVVVTDGICRIGQGSTSIRLRADSLSVLGHDCSTENLHEGKRAVKLSASGVAALTPVARIYVLRFGKVPVLEQLSPVLAATALSIHSFVRRTRYRDYEPEVVRAHLKQCAEVVAGTPVCRLARLQTLETMDDVVRTIEEDFMRA